MSTALHEVLQGRLFLDNLQLSSVMLGVSCYVYFCVFQGIINHNGHPFAWFICALNLSERWIAGRKLCMVFSSRFTVGALFLQGQTYIAIWSWKLHLWLSWILIHLHQLGIFRIKSLIWLWISEKSWCPILQEWFFLPDIRLVSCCLFIECRIEWRFWSIKLSGFRMGNTAPTLSNMSTYVFYFITAGI